MADFSYASDPAVLIDATQQNADALVHVLQATFGAIGRYVRPSLIYLRSDVGVMPAVLANNVNSIAYVLIGDMMHLDVMLTSFTTPACNSISLRIPDGYIAANRSGGPCAFVGLGKCQIYNGGASTISGAISVKTVGDVWVVISTDNGSTFPAAAGALVRGSIQFECAPGAQ